MKKAKIMLMAIAAIAITGGALAFKARTFGTIDICRTTAQAGGCQNLLCKTMTTFSTADDSDNPEFCYTAVLHDDLHDNASCADLACPNPGENLQLND